MVHLFYFQHTQMMKLRKGKEPAVLSSPRARFQNNCAFFWCMCLVLMELCHVSDTPVDPMQAAETFGSL